MLATRQAITVAFRVTKVVTAKLIDPESLYAQLRHVIKEWPDLRAHPLPREALEWLGRVTALVEAGGDLGDLVVLKVQVPTIVSGFWSGTDVAIGEITAVVYRALARAERDAPVAARNAFIPAQNSFDALAAVGKVAQSASKSLFIVDPYMDANALTDFAVLAPETIVVRLLADQAFRKDPLIPMVGAWKKQYGLKRPLEARLAPGRSLHDRLLIPDLKEAWFLSQSLNAFAQRSPASIERSDPEVGALKIAYYESVWANSTPI